MYIYVFSDVHVGAISFSIGMSGFVICIFFSIDVCNFCAASFLVMCHFFMCIDTVNVCMNKIRISTKTLPISFM